MIWLTWRQFRAGAITGAAAIAALAVTLGVVGANLAHLYDASGIPGCHAHGDCRAVASSFLSQVQSDHVYSLASYLGLAVVLITPAVIGMFWGAPLIARELEAGTFRLAWNQSVTRNRWIAVKLAAIGLAAMATTGLLSLISTWWVGPVFRANVLAGASSPLYVSRFTPAIFAGQGIVPIGYAAFAFVLGVAAGLLSRRTVPAMAATLAAFAAVQLAWGAWVRPHLIDPVRSIAALGSVTFSGIGESNHGSLFLKAGGRAGAWILSSEPVNAAGQAVRQVPAGCQRAFGASQMSSFLACLSRQGVKIAVAYQPDSRYWNFQWIELGAFLVLAGLLAWFCVRRVTRRFA
jgi:hypothetical protein